jgi:hypothetical protein
MPTPGLHVQNEQIKLLANALNTACTSCITVGIATPIAGYLYDVSGFRSHISVSTLLLGGIGRLAGAAALHLLARRVVGGLRP